MNLFYIGINPRFQSYPWLPRRVNVMVSAAGYWDGKDWRYHCRFPRQTGSKWLDSGGFTLLNKYGNYPFSLMQYINFVCWLRPDFYASMDYPCEPNITRTLSLMTNQERITKTIENAVFMADWESYTNSQLVPVIQGYTLDEYLSCIELYQQAGMIREYMAVGSMCRRISNKELHNLIPEIYGAGQKVGVKRLHFFGLKLSPDLIDLSPLIYSRDSAVALDAYDPELRKQREGRRWPRGPHEKRLAFNSFLQRLSNLGLNYMKERKNELQFNDPR